MKPVIIIAIAVVLLIPISAYADEHNVEDITTFEAMIYGIAASGLVGLAVSRYFYHLDKKRRNREKEIEKKAFKVKEAQCIRELLSKQWTHRTGKWLKLLSGMTDDEFIQFRNKYPEIIPAGQNKDKEPLFKIGNRNEFLEKYGVEESE